MPNGVYNWYCVLHSLGTITRHAAAIRVGSQYSLSPPATREYLDSKTGRQESQIPVEKRAGQPSDPPRPPVTSDNADSLQNTSGGNASQTPVTSTPEDIKYTQADRNSTERLNSESSRAKSVRKISSNSTTSNERSTLAVDQSMRSSRVPSSPVGRFLHYGGLAASLSFGAATEMVRRASGQNDHQDNSLLLTEANLNRLVSKLSKMRGAALKMGQFMSIQDTHVLPEDLERVFQRVQHAAHYMPNSQLEKVMIDNLGESWESHFSSFSRIPSHAASIGQVHIGILCAKSSPTGKEEEVAVKVQFPNIERSISSDLGYLKLLLSASMLLPKGLFLDSTIKVFKEELADECDYEREAAYINKYRGLFPEQLDSRFRVPWVWEGSTRHVLVMERMKGVSIGGDVVKSLTQEERNELSSRVLELCLRELFQFRMMQTDPNWSNFLWNKDTRQIELVDFGATREYSSEFTDNWLRLLKAAISGDRDECIDASLKLKYFIGGENEEMINAHILSMQLLGTPFRASTPQPFSFSRGSGWTKITEGIRAQVPIMLNNRLTPPPRQTYSLNRKLSGAFLLAARLGGSVDCRRIWEKVIIDTH